MHGEKSFPNWDVRVFELLNYFRWLEDQKKICVLGACELLDEEGRQSIADWIVGFLNYEVVAAVLTSSSDYTNRKICAEFILNAYVKTSFCLKLIFFPFMY